MQISVRCKKDNDWICSNIFIIFSVVVTMHRMQAGGKHGMKSSGDCL